MLLLSCLLAAITVLPGDTAKKGAAKTPGNQLIQPDKGDEITCFLCEPAPAFPGGEEALVTYLEKNLKYPAAALKAKMSGTIFVQFIVSKDGVIREVHPVGQYKGYGMEQEAVRVISHMPEWTPARMAGKPVDVLFNIPIRFMLPKQKS